MVSTASTQKIGNIVQVFGSTFDVEFNEGQLPEIDNAWERRCECPSRLSCNRRTIAAEVRS